MRWSLAVARVLLALPADTLAQAPAQPKLPEALLPASCLAYVRFDGIAPHRRAYEQTALAKVMSEDLGEFCHYLVAFVLENAFDRTARNTVPPVAPSKDSVSTFRVLLDDGAGDLAKEPPQPDVRARAARSAKVRAQLTKLTGYLCRKGFAAA